MQSGNLDKYRECFKQGSLQSKWFKYWLSNFSRLSGGLFIKEKKAKNKVLSIVQLPNGPKENIAFLLLKDKLN